MRDVDHLKCVLLDCWDQIGLSQDTINKVFKKTLTTVISAHDGHVHSISISCEF